MAKLELLVTLYTSEKYDEEAAENRRARQKNDRILPTADKLAIQVMNVVNGLGYVRSVDSCRVMQEVASHENEHRDVAPAIDSNDTGRVPKQQIG